MEFAIGVPDRQLVKLWKNWPILVIYRCKYFKSSTGRNVHRDQDDFL